MEDPALEEVLLEVLDSRLADVHTALPGKIVSYDAAKQTANIQLQIKDVDRDDAGNIASRSFPILPNVPIAWPRAGGFFLHLPLAAGDFVYVVFAESAIDQWRAKGVETAPGDIRRHSLTGAVAFPCLYPRDGALDEPDSGVAVLGKEGEATDFVALATKVLTELQAIKTAYDLHTHTCAAPSNPGSAPINPLPAPSSVASTDVKVT